MVGGPHEKRSGARKYPVTSNFHSPVTGSATAAGASEVVVTRPLTWGAFGSSPSAGALPPFFFGAAAGAGAGAAGVTSGAGAAAGGGPAGTAVALSCASAGKDQAESDRRLVRTRGVVFVHRMGFL